MYIGSQKLTVDITPKALAPFVDFTTVQITL